MSEEDYLTEAELNCLKFLEAKDETISFQRRSTIKEEQAGEAEQSFDLLFNLHPNQEMQEAKRKLQQIRQQLGKLGSLSDNLKQFQHCFKRLAESKSSLEESIRIVQGDSGHILERQNKMVGLSLGMQEVLDYYNHIAKFRFGDVVQISNDAASLQIKLSELTEGAEFFASHPAFSSASKNLQRYEDQKKKLLGFVRSFLLKIFNKEDHFVTRHSKSVHLQSYFENCYPKSTFKFLSDYLVLFPQFKGELDQLYSSAKERQEDVPQQLLKREQEMEGFLLTPAVKSLVRYIEFNQQNLFGKTLLDFFSFYRSNLHKTLASQFQVKKQPLEAITYLLNYIMYIVPSEMAYLTHCLNLQKANNLDTVKTILTGIVKGYSQLLRPSVIKLKGWKQITNVFKQVNKLLVSMAEIIDNYVYKMEYKTYPLGRVMNMAASQTQAITDIIRSVFDDLFAILEKSLQFYLPKDFSIPKIACPEPSIEELIDILSNLKYCPKLSSSYVVQSLDNILRAINDASKQLQTRYQAFLWNLSSVYAIQTGLSFANITKPLMKTQMSLSLGGTVSMLNSVGKIQNKGNIWNYAKEVFSTLSTGLPVLNQLTIDFNDHLESYMQKLQSQFIKDLTFVYGKGMIQFLQKSHSETQQDIQTLMSPDNLKQQYQRLVLGMGEFVSESIKQFQIYKKGYLIQGALYGPKLMTSLMQQVLQNMLQLLSEFYIASSGYIDVGTVEKLEFRDIKEVKNDIVSKLKNS